MDFLRNSQISGSSNFQLFGNSENSNYEYNQNVNNNINIKSSFNLLDDLIESLNKNISDSVMDLTKCFICLSPTNDPLSCPKCNNFACKRCLEAYFGDYSTKKCPLCKQDIKFNELKGNQIIGEIENILNKDDTKKNKIDELSNLIKEKKMMWENQGNTLNNLIERIFVYQKNVLQYKKEFESFFLQWKNVIEKAFQDYEIKIQELINSLLSYNNNAKQSIIKCDEIDKKNKNNFYSNQNIKVLINEVLSMERKHFNEEKNNETENFLLEPIKIIPSISYNLINDLNISKDDFKYSSISKKSNHEKIGNYLMKFIFGKGNKYSSLVEFEFTLNDKKNATYFITQKKSINSKFIEMIPMKLKKNEGKTYTYECNVNFDEFEKSNEKIKMETILMSFGIDK